MQLIDEKTMMDTLSKLITETEHIYAPIYGMLNLEAATPIAGYLALTETSFLFVALDPDSQKTIAFTKTPFAEMQKIQIKKNFLSRQYTIQIQFSGQTSKFSVSEQLSVGMLFHQSENVKEFVQKLKALPQGQN